MDTVNTALISPVSRLPFFLDGDRLVTADHGEECAVDDGILMLQKDEPADAAVRHEQNVFDHLPLRDVPYFRPGLFKDMLGRLHSGPAGGNSGTAGEYRFAELGGGEGHCARFIKAALKMADVYVCDVSRASLERAPRNLIRVCADITLPVFAPGSLRAAAFWVSLHHIPREHWRRSFEEVYRALEPGGVLLVFEPNAGFFPRRLLYRSPFRNDVYFDDQESAVDFRDVVSAAGEAGFEERETIYVNPPYNFDFVRQLRRWYLYFPVVETLYLLDRIATRLTRSATRSQRHGSRRRYFTLYGMAVLGKPEDALHG